MTKEELKHRTKQFALDVFKFLMKIEKCKAVDVVSYQLFKSSSSVAANYRAVCRARSDREFIAKMNIVLEESDETLFWLELIEAKKWLDDETLLIAAKEGNELTSIFVSSLKTVKSRINNS